jgi:hypothetical protein
MEEEKRQHLLGCLKAELKAIETGNFKRAPKQPWRARLVFEDSPCCPNYNNKGERVPCEECALMDLVPMDRRQEAVPCRFIQLNATGDTIDSLYRSGTQQELETALAEWLRKTIGGLEGHGVHPQLALSAVKKPKELAR